ncbi:MerR family transcriptional regulator [Lapidilactobacillus mulanensis]|uniref:MerR family transcriptional regulator n=1 Tax=Lapidilactobacillus mulanensis TaxID=2485999 RepID=A0ABW4DQJ4_9LACO|nr:MerR family transcriptional regulator [Lapidilactobacillus mulanensis]
MAYEQLRADLSILPIGTAMKLTGLTARQIRYYEANQLIKIVRSESNQRLFSLVDLQCLIQIKNLLHDEHNVAQVRQLLTQLDVQNSEHHDSQLRQTLQDELWLASPFSRSQSGTRQSPFFKP